MSLLKLNSSSLIESQVNSKTVKTPTCRHCRVECRVTDLCDRQTDGRTDGR